MKSISIVFDYNSFEFKGVLLRELPILLDNETCARGLNCSFTYDFIHGESRLSLSLISGEEFTYQFFIEVVSLVNDIFDKKNIFMKVKSVSAF